MSNSANKLRCSCLLRIETQNRTHVRWSNQSIPICRNTWLQEKSYDEHRRIRFSLRTLYSSNVSTQAHIQLAELLMKAQHSVYDLKSNVCKGMFSNENQNWFEPVGRFEDRSYAWFRFQTRQHSWNSSFCRTQVNTMKEKIWRSHRIFLFDCPICYSDICTLNRRKSMSSHKLTSKSDVM